MCSGSWVGSHAGSGSACCDLAKLALAVERGIAAQRTPIHTTTKENTLTPITV